MTYAASCREWGIDPAAEVEDPWLAHQLRLGLTYALRKHEREAEERAKDEAERKAMPDEHDQRIDRARRLLGDQWA